MHTSLKDVELLKHF